ncbi:MAG: hypothetical protein U9Q06_00235 [Nanoarchaeota archaeon]|nr:hypothetical protein [Nanoarchaeota archaeon]
MHITPDSASYIFEDYYTSILELIQALCFMGGFNVNNHICLGFYLRDVLNKKELFQKFDDLRYKRNSLVYHGQLMDFEIAKKAISDSKILKEGILMLIKNHWI